MSNVTVGDLGYQLALEINKHLEPSGLSKIGHELLLAEITELRRKLDYNVSAVDAADRGIIMAQDEIRQLAECCMELERELSRSKRNHRAAGVVIRSLRKKLDAPRRRCDICLS